MMLKAGVVADTVSYNTLIRACAEACEEAKAKHCLGMMSKAGVEADAISYMTVIDASAAARDVAKAEHWTCMMLNAGVVADTISYNTVTRGHVQRLVMWPKLITGYA